MAAWSPPARVTPAFPTRARKSAPDTPAEKRGAVRVLAAASGRTGTNTLTAPRFPAGVSGADFLARVGKAGVTLAGGLHAAIRSEYFRVGHMGAVSAGDVLAVLGAVETALHGCGYVFEAGAGVTAAQALISA